MHKRLKWNAIGLELKTNLLLENINKEKENEPEAHSKKHEKLQRFIDDLSQLIDGMRKIKEELIPKLEKVLRLEFKTPELIMLALARPSIRNIYEDLENGIKTLPNQKLINVFKYLTDATKFENSLSLLFTQIWKHYIHTCHNSYPTFC